MSLYSVDCTPYCDFMLSFMVCERLLRSSYCVVRRSLAGLSCPYAVVTPVFASINDVSCALSSVKPIFGFVGL